MTHDTHTAGRSRFTASTPDQADRILVGAAVAIWLAALGAGVAAVVALVDLARGRVAESGATETPWLLYAVIGVSAAVIVGAIPLLLRARRTGSTSVAGPRTSYRPESGPSDDVGAAPKLEPFGAPVIRRPSMPPATSRVAFPVAAVDQVWLRFTALTAGAIGAAMTGIGIATYLMASQHDSAAWVTYAVAGLITVAMPVVPYVFLRQLDGVLH